MNKKPGQTKGAELAKGCSRVVKMLCSNIQTEKQTEKVKKRTLQPQEGMIQQGGGVQ